VKRGRDVLQRPISAEPFFNQPAQKMHRIQQALPSQTFFERRESRK
jgi:hypothetical protein